MNELLCRLLSDNQLSTAEMQRLGEKLLEELESEMGVAYLRVVESRIDDTGKAPGLFLKLHFKAVGVGFDIQWNCSLSLTTYDVADRVKINACAYFWLFVEGLRVTTKTGSVLLFSLR
jgi:hypothetical protein